MPSCNSNNKNKGHLALEFSLVLPIFLLLVLAALDVALLAIHGEVASLASSRIARIAKVFQEDLSSRELYALLTPEFTGNTWIEWSYPNSNPGSVSLKRFVRSVTAIDGLGNRRRLERKSPVVPALVGGLSEGVLRGGDTPSPYCNGPRGYQVCGYPE